MAIIDNQNPFFRKVKVLRIQSVFSVFSLASDFLQNDLTIAVASVESVMVFSGKLRV